jgi:undecaprenyl-diphosphatase
MELWQILVLAAVQGVTEFLPISSDGHLVALAPLVYGGSQPPDVPALVIVLHIGTLGSILVFYWRRVVRLLFEDRRLIPLLIVGTLPAVLAGVPIKMFAESMLESVWLAGLMLPVTGLILIYIGRRPGGERDYRELTLRDAWWIGVAQASAILPGLSRSGSTIATALGRGTTRASAATFSFLLAIPAIAGAGVLEVLKTLLKGESVAMPMSHLAIGAGVSFGVGLVALWWLNVLLERGKLHWFAWYCIGLGLLVLGLKASGSL